MDMAVGPSKSRLLFRFLLKRTSTGSSRLPYLSPVALSPLRGRAPSVDAGLASDGLNLPWLLTLTVVHVGVAVWRHAHHPTSFLPWAAWWCALLTRKWVKKRKARLHKKKNIGNFSFFSVAILYVGYQVARKVQSSSLPPPLSPASSSYYYYYYYFYYYYFYYYYYYYYYFYYYIQICSWCMHRTETPDVPATIQRCAKWRGSAADCSLGV